jgi:DNA polymerase/3'-5' exonuclease PolX
MDHLLDLRQDALKSTTSNDGILSMLNELIEHYVSLKSTAAAKDRVAIGHKISSFTKGRDAISGFTRVITSGAQARKEIPGVGEGIAKRIDEFLKTGALQELQKEPSSLSAIVLDLTTVTGIGEVKARNLIEQFNVTSVQDLIDKYRSGKIAVAPNQLTHHIAVCLNFYHDLQQRMPWSEADQIAKRVQSVIFKYDPQLLVTVCGSYRRKRPTCGDIDVLVTHGKLEHPEETLKAIVKLLEKDGLLVNHLTANGDTKYMGVCKLNSSSTGRRIDIRFVPYNCFGAAILYFTGSGKFNKIMRLRANQRGYTLNEYGLFHYENDTKGAQVSTPTEEDVFKTLRFLYLTPEERDF